MLAARTIDYSSRESFYREVESEIKGLLEPVWFSNLSNASASLMSHLPEINWVGFYLTHGEQLLLGPFQGLPACLRIPYGKGVCGTAAQNRTTVVIPDVDAFPGHIACDTRSRSEIVVPMILGGRVLGVLDIDSPIKERFDDQDKRGLESIVSMLVASTPWPKSFLEMGVSE